MFIPNPPGALYKHKLNILTCRFGMSQTLSALPFILSVSIFTVILVVVVVEEIVAIKCGNNILDIFQKVVNSMQTQKKNQIVESDTTW